ncbi:MULTISPECIES: Hsp20/alpha crystallin family protein [unclassified Leptolyngbya]|uniref:Hsp20/alpha crystallin family protein n=1 Tax=unclassified Leptolyngbya TaxID=2650499 RepID=UPI0016862CF3|nr:Hsp20/alpha crystallin family protein [Leptolyngbya sp. FACHB-16]MBD1913185.1 Hsp20/alpha crystallin family protein [Leptolyngbya sp. FACHB-8]MBD2156705.1 Hsp20/alpha crystallin family protein [Leptolyngbya sp. FACHB-16]
MLTRYRHPLYEIEAMRRQFDHLFDELTTTNTQSSVWTPAIELQDTGDAFTLRAQIPGLEAKDIDIQVSREAIAISGERHQQSKQKDNNILRSEFRYGKFHRVLRLPAAVQNDQIQAEYKDGILHLTLPKTPEVRNQVIKVSLSNTPVTSESEPAIEANS